MPAKKRGSKSVTAKKETRQIDDNKSQSSYDELQTSTRKTTVQQPNFDLDNILNELPQPNFSAQINFNGGGTKANKQHKASSSIRINATQTTKAQSQKLPSNELPEGYVEVPTSERLKIPIDSYIKYIDQSGILRAGGKFRGYQPIENSSDTYILIGKYMITIKKYVVWKVKISTLQKIYKLTTTTAKQSGKPAKQGGTEQGMIITNTEGTQNISATNTVGTVGAADNAIVGAAENNDTDNSIISQLGNKLLFEEGDFLKQKVDNLELEIKRIDEDVKKIFILVKRLYKKIGME